MNKYYCRNAGADPNDPLYEYWKYDEEEKRYYFSAPMSLEYGKILWVSSNDLELPEEVEELSRLEVLVLNLESGTKSCPQYWEFYFHIFQGNNTKNSSER